MVARKVVASKAGSPDTVPALGASEDHGERVLCLNVLRAILAQGSSLVATSEGKYQEPPKRPRSVSATATNSHRRTKSTATKKSRPESRSNPDFIIHEQHESKAKIPQPETEQRRYAATAFNSNLKVLNAFVKKRQERLPPAAGVKATKDRSRPLTETTGNEANVNTITAESSASKDEIRLAAECASTALGVLRKLDHGAEEQSETAEKREMGALVFLDRLISLELGDNAFAQACHIHEQYWKRRRHGLSNSKSLSGVVAPSISQLLVFGAHINDAAHFRFVVSLQIQLLRLASLLHRRLDIINFVQTTIEDSSTSPAGFIERAHRLELVDSKDAATHMAAISQAMLKLYLTTVRDPNRDPSCLHAFKILAYAQLCRIQSWCYTDHDPNLLADLWVAFDAALKRLWKSSGARVEQVFAKYDLTLSTLQTMQAKLKLANLPSSLPSFVQAAFSDLAEVHDDIDTAVALLRGLAETSTGHEQLLYKWRFLAALLKNRNTDHVELHQILCNANVDLTGKTVLDSFKDPSTMLAAISLRKAICAYLPSMLENSKDCTSLIRDISLSAFETINGILQNMLSCVSALGLQSSKAHTVTLLKSVDVVADLEQYFHSCDACITIAYKSTLQLCVDAVNEFVDSASTRSQPIAPPNIPALAIKLSNVLWRLHRQFAANGPDATVAIECAEQSINVLRRVPVSSLDGAALGPKLENLAKLYATSKNFNTSQICRRDAAKHYIASGALDEAIERASCCPSDKIWINTDGLAFQLARSIRAFLDNAILKLDQQKHLTLIYDDETLGPEARFVLLELQVVYLLRPRLNDDSILAAQEALRVISGLCTKPKYFIWHARLCSQVLFRASSMRNFEVESCIGFEKLQSIAVSCEENSNPALKSWSHCLHALLLLQTYFLRDELKLHNQSLMTEATSLCLHILSRPDATELDLVVDNYDSLTSTLEGVADWADAMQEDALRYQCIRSIHHINTLRLGDSSFQSLHSAVNLVESALSIQDTKVANEQMTCIQKLGHQNNDILFTTKSLIVQAKYHTSILDLQACGRVLTQLENTRVFSGSIETSKNARTNLLLDLLLVEALTVSFQFSFGSGLLQQACRAARQAIRLTTFHWASIDSKSRTPTIHEDAISSANKELSTLKSSSVDTHSRSQFYGVRYWRLLKLHLESLKQMSIISAHQGLCNDAIYYAQKLSNLAKTLSLEQHLTTAEVDLALLHARARCKDRVLKELVPVGDLVGDLSHFKSSLVALNYAELCFEDDDVEKAREIVSRLSNLAALSPFRSHSSISESKPKTCKARRPGAKTVPKPPTRQAKTEERSKTPQMEIGSAQTKTHFTLAQWQYEDRLQALQSRLSLPLPAQSSLASDEKNYVSSVPNGTILVYSKVARATSLYDRAMKLISEDAIASLLTDSAVALPAKHNHRRISFLQGFESEKDSDISPQKHQSTAEKFVGKTILAARIELKRANDLLKQLKDKQVDTCPSYLVHDMRKLRSKISLLASSLSLPFSYSPLQVVLESMEPLQIAEEREQQFAFAEQMTETTAQIREWHFHGKNEARASASVLGSHGDFVMQIPDSWQVLSISLAEGANELHVARLTGGCTSPFVIQLPISRSNEGDTENVYAFTQAKEELEKIIIQANKSSHERGGHDDDGKQRQIWNKHREALDMRLRDWLTDIDSIWLGGFRGVFSPFRFEQKLVARFGRALSRALQKYLPSRQKNSPQEVHVDIHSHVLELFLGLGDLDAVELDNAIMDLLYFVVDILQASGERNAYDEIDWDKLLVEVVDAINAFHTKANLSEQQPRHTILILDKELLSFPWENLPCLRDQPVTRMPSLSALQHRLRLIRAQACSNISDVFRISRNNHRGAYVLNPSKDLPTTQTTFEPILSENEPTSAYRSIIATAPTESQFTSLLTDSQLLLYFGHGSGAQYIRGRHIRSLCCRDFTDDNSSNRSGSSTIDSVSTNVTENQDCVSQIATTFLMGCSSAALNPHGKYEPHGPPGWYMLAGAPALVGTLWDVTDRDIDRFAVKTFAEWGLVDAEDENVVKALERSQKARLKREELRRKKLGGKQQTRVGLYDKEKEVSEKNCGEGVPLDEAVRRGRDACLLRWLNGASVVVYGCPVIISD